MPVIKSPAKTTDKLTQKIEGIQRRKQQEAQGELLSGSGNAEPQPAADKPVKKPRAKAKPKAEKAVSKEPLQPDFFMPMIYDIGTRDIRSLMDVAPFRLSKTQKRENDVIRYELPDGEVVVSSGVYGMASVFDYDLVLMATSHLTEAMNRFRKGEGEKPGQVFRPHIGDVIKFTRKTEGGNQRKAWVSALERLSTTHVKIKRTRMIRDRQVITDEGETLIGPYRTITNAKNGNVEYLEFKVADWLYKEITTNLKPDILAVHPDYFEHESGYSRFIYRLARKAAGKEMAVWGFELIHQRSGSNSTFKEFSRNLRKVIKENDVPEYDLSEEPGVHGPQLCMVYRKSIDHLK
jgi:ribosomal protein L17